MEMKIYESRKFHKIEYPNGYVYNQPYSRVIDLRGTGIEAYQFRVSPEYRVGDIIIESDDYVIQQEERFLDSSNAWRGTSKSLAFFTQVSAEVRDYLAAQ